MKIRGSDGTTSTIQNDDGSDIISIDDATGSLTIISSPLSFKTNSTERMKITSDGESHFFGMSSLYPFIMKGNTVSNPGTNWQTVHTFTQYASTGFMLMVSYEDNAADSNNRFAIFVDSGTSSYGGGFSVSKLHGSTDLEAQRSTYSLQVRHASSTSNNCNLQWQLFLLRGYGS